MERERIIEALKICDSNYDGVVCKKCPIKDENYNGSWYDKDGECYQHLMREAAELLSEQSAIQSTRPDLHWIPVSERMPEEHESMFSKFHGTPRWSQSMWLRQSDQVLVTSELADGTRITETARTRDGEWKPDHVILKREIVAWMPMPMPKPYKEDRK